MRGIIVERMRELEAQLVQVKGITIGDLMDTAGAGVALELAEIIALAGRREEPIRVFVGPGNNGGDALVAARHLHEQGFRVEVWLAQEPSRFKDESLARLELAIKAGVPIHNLAKPEDLAELQPGRWRGVILDGILGTGVTGALRGASATAVDWINKLAPKSLVVALDLPSGLDAEGGGAVHDAVRADFTLTIGWPKKGVLAEKSLPYVGSLSLVDIGIEPDWVTSASANGDLDWVTTDEVADLFPKRERVAHKGDFGHVLIIGGARGYSGAITLAIRAGLRSGVGLVSALVPQSIVPLVAPKCPEAMVNGVAETEIGSLAKEFWPAWRDKLGAFTAILVGPGLTRHEESRELVRLILQEAAVPLVVDASALSVWENQADIFRQAKVPVVITPHPGELGRLLGSSIQAIQADRVKAAVAAVSKTRAIVVLKGAGTLIAGMGGMAINLTGNPGMAVGGSGDVLAGLMAGILAQGMSPESAAKAAVYIHGRAGDRLALKNSQIGLEAGDFVRELPAVWRELLS